jgi:hypothetical protein
MGGLLAGSGASQGVAWACPRCGGACGGWVGDSCDGESGGWAWCRGLSWEGEAERSMRVVRSRGRGVPLASGVRGGAGGKAPMDGGGGSSGEPEPGCSA